jgi:hypothetical protein
MVTTRMSVAETKGSCMSRTRDKSLVACGKETGIYNQGSHCALIGTTVTSSARASHMPINPMTEILSGQVQPFVGHFVYH